ncbi:MAG: AraC family transcriptional regulator, partial [Chitinophagaceae bacterium]
MPTMFPQMFGINASELSNKAEQLTNVIPDVASFIQSHFHQFQQSDEIKALLDECFLSQNQPINYDGRLYNAIDIILKNYGVLNVERDLDTGISARQLRRLFEFYIGDTPKTFSKVVRFQHILKAKPSSQSL